MPCIEMPEVAYSYGYLLVSARENAPEYGPILAYFAVTKGPRTLPVSSFSLRS
jgi:hypothetical protein